MNEKILILDITNNSLHKEEFVNPIENVLEKSDIKFQTINYKKTFTIENFSKIIISGTSLIDFDYIREIERFEFIKNTTKPILGICAGAQIISLLYGKNLRDNQEIGLYKINKIQDDAILNNLEFPLEVYELHNNTIHVPICFKTLLENDSPQLIKHKFKRIYSCMFHPEVRNHKLIENFINL